MEFEDLNIDSLKVHACVPWKVILYSQVYLTPSLNMDGLEPTVLLKFPTLNRSCL